MKLFRRKGARETRDREGKQNKANETQKEKRERVNSSGYEMWIIKQLYTGCAIQ